MRYNPTGIPGFEFPPNSNGYSPCISVSVSVSVSLSVSVSVSLSVSVSVPNYGMNTTATRVPAKPSALNAGAQRQRIGGRRSLSTDTLTMRILFTPPAARRRSAHEERASSSTTVDVAVAITVASSPGVEVDGSMQRAVRLPSQPRSSPAEESLTASNASGVSDPPPSAPAPAPDTSDYAHVHVHVHIQLPEVQSDHTTSEHPDPPLLMLTVAVEIIIIIIIIIIMLFT